MQRSRYTRVWVLIIGLFTVVLAAEPIKAGDLCSPCWDKKIDNANARFRVLNSFNDEAVLDRETQLVWARHPGEVEEPDFTTEWTTAVGECYVRDIGGRRGWRLPTVEELASLVDPNQTNPSLPIQHPFINVHSSKYWTATTRVDTPGFAWSVDFGSGLVGNAVGKTTRLFSWCVRGGQGIDGVQ